MQPQVGGTAKFSKAELLVPTQGGALPASDKPDAHSQVADTVKQMFDALRARKDGQTVGLIRQPSIRLEPHEVQKATLLCWQPSTIS